MKNIIGNFSQIVFVDHHPLITAVPSIDNDAKMCYNKKNRNGQEDLVCR